MIASNIASGAAGLGQPSLAVGYLMFAIDIAAGAASFDQPDALMSEATWSTSGVVTVLRNKDIDECVKIVKSVTGFLMGALTSSGNSTQLVSDVGALNATAATQLVDGTLGSSLQQCFADVVPIATLSQMMNVLSEITALQPVSFAAKQLVDLCVILALTTEANIIVLMTFTDRETVEATMTLLNPQFNDAIERAADTGASDTMLALISLQSQVTQYLLVTEQPLPFLVEYVSGRSLPSFTLAMRLYADPNDVEMLANQLVAENQVVNPAFMPSTGLALSAP